MIIAGRTDIVLSNAFTRVFHVRGPTSTATAFTFDVDGKSYLVTAKHFAETLGSTIDVQLQGQWKQLQFELTGHGIPPIDVSVLALKEKLGSSFEFTPSPRTWVGQQLYFIGFPFGLRSELLTLNEGWSMPLVKSATLSAYTAMQGQSFLLLDGHNNPGFSGGPVVCSGYIEGEPRTFIVGIVSGYHVEQTAVHDASSNQIGSNQGNSGIIIAWDFQHALSLIAANPNGHPVA